MRAGLLTFLTALVLIGTPAMAIEQPRHTVERDDGRFQLRRYAPYVVAEVEVAGDQKKAVQAGFRKLAGYIFGGNQGRASIAMTAPVAQAPAVQPPAASRRGQTIAMTAPVAQTPTTPGRWTVQFMMPAAWSLAELPRPNDPDVTFRAQPARRMAVVTFSGVAGQKTYAQRTAELQTWIAAQGLKPQPAAAPVLAQYDPPWTPWFMRRNEVQIEVAPN